MKHLRTEAEAEAEAVKAVLAEKYGDVKLVFNFDEYGIDCFFQVKINGIAHLANGYHSFQGVCMRYEIATAEMVIADIEKLIADERPDADLYMDGELIAV